MIDKLKREYELRYNLMRYCKLQKSYLCTIIEKNNYEYLLSKFEDVKKEDS